MATETEKTIKARQIQKNDTSANWSKAVNFTPLKGELIVYTDLNKIKIGDGVTKVNDLPFSNDDKVAKSGDTMTGMLGVNLSAYPGSGGIVFGVNAPSELAVLEPSITGASGVNNSIDLVAKTVCIGHLSGDDETVRVQFNETENLIQNGLTFLNSERLKKGTVSETNDGLALSAENGTCVKVGAQAVTVCDNAGGTSQIKGVATGTENTDAVNVKQLRDAGNVFVKKTGDTMSGQLKMDSNANGIIIYDQGGGRYARYSGGAIRGSEYVELQYLDPSVPSDLHRMLTIASGKVEFRKGGSSSNNPCVVSGIDTPVDATDAVNKGYVDGLTAQATETTLGTIKAPAATDAYTTSVGINESGLLYAQDLTDAEITEVLTSVGFITQEAG